MMEYCIYEAKLDHNNGENDPDIKKPDKLSHSKWVYCDETVYTYFTAIWNSQLLSLT